MRRERRAHINPFLPGMTAHREVVDGDEVDSVYSVEGQGQK